MNLIDGNFEPKKVDNSKKIAKIVLIAIFVLVIAIIGVFITIVFIILTLIIIFSYLLHLNAQYYASCSPQTQ